MQLAHSLPQMFQSASLLPEALLTAPLTTSGQKLTHFRQQVAKVRVCGPALFFFFLFLADLGKSSRIVPASVFGCRYVRTGQLSSCVALFFHAEAGEKGRSGSRVALDSTHLHSDGVLGSF